MNPRPVPSLSLGLTLGLLLTAACSSKAPPSPRGVQLDPNRVRKAGPAAEEEEEPAEEPQAEAPRRSKLKSPFEELGPGDLMAEPGAAPPAEAPAEEPGEERDLGKELADMLGRPGCFDFAAAAKQGRLTVSGTVYVMASGRITRASVSASGQSSAALRCAESRLVAQGMKGPIPGGAQSVSGSTTLEVTATEAPRQREERPTPAQAAPQAPTPPEGTYAQPSDPGREPEIARPNADYGFGTAQPDQMAGAP